MIKLKKKSKASAAAAPRKPRDAQTLRSLPEDVVLAPQAEAPRQMLGQDRSRTKTRVRELSWAEFDRQVQALARALKKSYRADAVVGVAHGGVFVGGALAGALKQEFFPVRISRRSRDSNVRQPPRLYGEMPRELKGRRVLIVDDVSASGDTLELATALAEKVGAREVRTAALISRDEGYAPSYSAITSGDIYVFPWDYDAVTEDSRFDVDPDKAGA